jgi:transposase
LAKSAEESAEEITRMITVKSKPSRKPLDITKLPVEVENIYPEGTTDENGNLRTGYVEIGTEETSRLERIPAKVYIVRTVRHKIISKSDITDKHPEERGILIAALPLAPVSKCIAGASVLAGIITGKFMYHLPFYRQIQQYREAGITISDSTMGG